MKLSDGDGLHLLVKPPYARNFVRPQGFTPVRQAREIAMREYLRSRHIIFDPETVRVLCLSLDEAWAAAREQHSPSRLDGRATRQCMARRIVELAFAGERNADKLRDGALRHLAAVERRCNFVLVSTRRPDAIPP